MNIGVEGENLVFIISQPRSGSTMLQRMLGGHPEVCTTSEPWLLLNPARILAARCSLDGLETEYARENVQRFLSKIKNGKNEYRKASRKMYSYLYNKFVENRGARIFVDKTPRYAYVLSEIVKIFPRSTYIILYRNPLSVLFSIINSFTGYRGDLFTKHYHADDLLEVPSILTKEIYKKKDNFYTTHFEKIVKNPQKEVSRLLTKIGAKNDTKLVEYKDNDLPKWRFGDQNVYDFERPNPDRASSWKQDIRKPSLWTAADDYLRKIPKKTVKKMGYNYDKIVSIKDRHKPNNYELLKFKMWNAFISLRTHPLTELFSLERD